MRKLLPWTLGLSVGKRALLTDIELKIKLTYLLIVQTYWNHLERCTRALSQ